MVGLGLLILIVLGAIFGPLIYPTDPYEMVWAPFSPPGQEGFLLGTDYLGRDILSQLLNGARVTLIIGLAAAFVTVAIGITVGALAGFYGGAVEEALMRFTEFFQVLPTLLFSMVIVSLFGASLPMITFAIGVVSWTAVARITRAEFLRIREMDYVMASRASGAPGMRLMFTVILPNSLPPIIVQSALMVGSAILFEAGLSFLGLTNKPAGEKREIVDRLFSGRGPQARAETAFPASVLGRPTPAHRHRPSPEHPARGNHLRRARLGTRRGRAGADPEPASPPAIEIRADLDLRQP